MNKRDSEAVAAMLRARGYRIVQDEEACDIMLFNTCSVRDMAEQKAIGKAGYAAKKKKRNPRFILGILGCMAQNRGASLLDALPDIDLIVGTQKFHQVPDHLDNLRAAKESGMLIGNSIFDIAEEPDSQNAIREQTLEEKQVTAFVSIQQGCNMQCTFCIVPKTRGDERSRPIDEIVRECEELADQGIKEITLLGQIVTSYGRRDYKHTGGVTPFVQLLERINAIPSLQRIRFTSPHPRGFKQDLVEAYGRLEKLCEHVHLPLQSGSNRILKLMNRPYSAERYLQIARELQRVQPDMHFSTDVIVGFPGETEEDFARTKELFEEIGYDMAYVFKYSIRSGTPSAEMDNQVPDEVKEERNEQILKILQASSKRRTAALIGTTQEVLAEGPDKKGIRFMGRNRGNRVVHFDATKRQIGELVPVKITHATATALYGKLTLSGMAGDK